MVNGSKRPGVIVVLVTCPSREVGEKIARAVVEDRLAACVNVVPRVTSVYRWEGKLHRDAESLLVIKTHRKKLPDLTRRVMALHPYTVPEVIALPVMAGSHPYFSWIRDSTS